MAISNTDFELEGATYGTALNWTETIVATLEEYAEFAQNPSVAYTLAVETFDVGWAISGDQAAALSFGTTSLLPAVFNVGPSQKPFETFNEGWGSPPLFASGLSALQVATFDGDEHEDFDWETLINSLVVVATATFDSNPEEQFEVWGGAFLSVHGSLQTGTTETFEAVFVPDQFSAIPGSDVLTAYSTPTNPFVTDEKVRLQQADDGSLPSPLTADVDYYINSPSGETFKLAAFESGPVIDLTTTGDGVHTFTRDPAQYWSTVMTTVLEEEAP